jgi:hypothetical protein
VISPVNNQCSGKEMQPVVSLDGFQ